MKKILKWAAIAAIAVYLFDPQQGRARRARLQDKIGALIRRGAREAERKAEYARGQAEGLRHASSSDSPPPNDEALTAKVKSEVLSRRDYPTGSIVVNSVDGIVELRGVCDSEDEITSLEQDVRKVTGVLDVHNYLHLPDTPAPNKQTP